MKRILKNIGLVALYMIIYFIIFQYSPYPIIKLARANESFKAWVINNQMISIIFNDLIGIAVFIPLIAFIKKQSLSKRCNFSAIKVKTGILIAVMAIASGIFTGSIFKMPVVLEKFPDITITLDYIINSSSLPIFLGFLIIGSIYKEILYRGLIFNELRESMSEWIAIIIQGLIYGILFFNFNIPLTIYGLLGAIIFALLYIWFKSMWAPIIAQIGSTGGLYILGKLVEPHVSSGLMAVIVISFVITIAGVYLLWRQKESK